MKKQKIRTGYGVLSGFLFLGLVLMATSMASANPLESLRNMTRRVEADPAKDYTLEERNGPWMIMAATFSGSTAAEDAKTLTFELRSKYKMEAYVFDKTFVNHISKEEASRSLYQRQLTYQNSGENHEYAVLVGNFVSLDDINLEKTLKALRECSPDCFQKSGKKTAKQKLAQIAEYHHIANAARPCADAFATTNPMLPKGMFGVKQGVADEFVEKLNADRPYSLLKNPGVYTIQVATFTGNIEINQNKIRQYEADKSRNTNSADNLKNSELEKAGLAAIRLCAILRAKGYDAYEFHDRYSSIVTIGTFDSLGTPQPNGTIEYRPEIVDILNRCTAKRVNPNMYANSGKKTISYEPIKVDGIELDLQPKPIMVPRVARRR